jgi:hypothetical protein
VLVWAGLIFGADYFGYLPQIGNAITWSWIFLGAGVYGLLINFIRIFSERISNSTSWEWIWAAIFLLFGLAGFITFSIPWWLFLILIGVAILGSAFIRRD